MLIVRPGAVSGWISLLDARKRDYERIKKFTDKALKERESAGVPLDDLEPLPPWEEQSDIQAHLDGVRVKLVAMSEAEFSQFATVVDARGDGWENELLKHVRDVDGVKVVNEDGIVVDGMPDDLAHDQAALAAVKAAIVEVHRLPFWRAKHYGRPLP